MDGRTVRIEYEVGEERHDVCKEKVRGRKRRRVEVEDIREEE